MQKHRGNCFYIVLGRNFKSNLSVYTNDKSKFQWIYYVKGIHKKTMTRWQFIFYGGGRGGVYVCVDNTMKRPWSNDLKARWWYNLGQMQPLTQVRASDVSFHKNCYIGPNMKVRWAKILWFPFTILCLKFSFSRIFLHLLWSSHPK